MPTPTAGRSAKPISPIGRLAAPGHHDPDRVARQVHIRRPGWIASQDSAPLSTAATRGLLARLGTIPRCDVLATAASLVQAAVYGVE